MTTVFQIIFAISVIFFIGCIVAGLIAKFKR